MSQPHHVEYARRDSHASLLSRALGLAAFLTLIGWALFSRADMSLYLDPASMMIGIGAPVMLLLATFGARRMHQAFRCALLGSKSKDEAAAATAFFRMAAAYAMACGFFGALSGLIVMLAHVDNPAALGPGTAVMLLTPLYGLLEAIAAIVLAGVVCTSDTSGDMEGALERFTRGIVPATGAATATGVVMVVVAVGFVFGIVT
jgi:hypothetical protein